MAKYEVTGYSSVPPQLWCVVDTTQFLDERARAANWPRQVTSTDCRGVTISFPTRDEAEQLAGELNRGEDRGYVG